MTPNADGPDIAQLPESVTRKIEVQANGCWHWTAAINPQTGYGNTYHAGSYFSSHRLVYSLLVGEIPKGLILHHVCHVRACCNPTHLELMTRKEHAAEHGLAGIAVTMAAQTRCINGHEFDGRNAKQRTCRTCRRAIGARWERAHRAQSGATT